MEPLLSDDNIIYNLPIDNEIGFTGADNLLIISLSLEIITLLITLYKELHELITLKCINVSGQSILRIINMRVLWRDDSPLLGNHNHEIIFCLLEKWST